VLVAGAAGEDQRIVPSHLGGGHRALLGLAVQRQAVVYPSDQLGAVELDLAGGRAEAAQPIGAVRVHVALVDHVLDDLGVDGDAVGVVVDLLAHVLGQPSAASRQDASRSPFQNCSAMPRRTPRSRNISPSGRASPRGLHHLAAVADLALVGAAGVGDQRRALQVGGGGQHDVRLKRGGIVEEVADGEEVERPQGLFHALAVGPHGGVDAHGEQGADGLGLAVEDAVGQQHALGRGPVAGPDREDLVTDPRRQVRSTQ
jgi:hypothetical protein